MVKREYREAPTAGRKSGGLDEACGRYGLGRRSMRQVAEDAHAVIKIGKRLLINFDKVDRYLDEMSA